MALTATVELLGDGDVRVVIVGTSVATGASVEVDLQARAEADDPASPYRQLRKLLLARVHSAVTAGTATEHDPILEKSGGLPEYEAAADAALAVDTAFAPAVPCYLPDGRFTYKPRVDAGSDNTIRAEILFSAARPGWGI